tara:strand:+ start:327 stop:1388 length:1062 start_codon:yes stop_codon:yes gene_type:complete
MNKIPKNLIEFIKSRKRISLSSYIEFCLLNDKNGYYQTKKSIGEDFITSPELNQVFGECISIFLVYISKLAECEKKKTVIELGPGNGTLAHDIMSSFKKLNVHNDWYYNLFEKSDRLKILQKKKLCENFKDNCKWINNFRTTYDGPHFFICNEFFDALPIDQYKKENNRFKKKKIFINSLNKLSSDFFKTEKKMKGYYKKINNGDILEISEKMEKIIHKLFKVINKKHGMVVLFDYGPFNKKNIDTLQSIYNGKKCDILFAPCSSDITHHIDFSYLKSIAYDYNLNVLGPITQRDFLLSMGAKQRLSILLSNAKNIKLQNNLLSSYKRLTDKNKMGELFKCIIFYTNRYKIPF